MWRSAWLALALLGGASVLATAAPAPTKPATAAKKAKKKKKRTKAGSGPSRYGKVDDASTTAAWRYGMMTQDECEAELTTRTIGFTREPASRGV